MDSIRKQPSQLSQPRKKPLHRFTQPVPPQQHVSQHSTPSPTETPPRSHSEKESPSFFVFAIVFFASSIIFLLLFFVFKTVQTASHVTADHTRNTTDTFTPKEHFLSTLTDLARSGDETILAGYTEGRINILLLGIAGTHKPGAMLTDTILLASIDTDHHTVALLSLPRDMIVADTDGTYKKINRLYSDGSTTADGATTIMQAVADITGQEIHYHIVMDFEGFIQIIDALKGINIDVPRDINDTRYPGPGYSYETFTLSAGLHHMDGATALKYARSRHDDPESDFGRAKRQQQVLRAARNKAFTLGTIANPFKINELLSAISDHVTMNITADEITAFITLMNNLDTHNVTTVVLDAWQKDSLLISARRDNLPGLLPRSGNWDETRELADNIFARDALRERIAAITTENSSVLLVNLSGAPITQHVTAYLTGRGFTTISTVPVPTKTPLSASTLILDRTDGERLFSLDDLVTRLNASLVTTLPESLTADTSTAGRNVIRHIDTVDFVVFLGENLASIYDYENITQAELEQSNTQ